MVTLQSTNPEEWFWSAKWDENGPVFGPYGPFPSKKEAKRASTKAVNTLLGEKSQHYVKEVGVYTTPEEARDIFRRPGGQ